MLRTRPRQKNSAFSDSPQAPLVPRPAHAPLTPAEQPARRPLRPWVRATGAAAAMLALAAGAALIEWAGWQIVWRHGGGPRPSDPTWLPTFVEGVGRNIGGAISIGAASAALALAVSLAVPRWRSSARRVILPAMAVGAVAFLGILGALTQWAP